MSDNHGVNRRPQTRRFCTHTFSFGPGYPERSVDGDVMKTLLLLAVFVAPSVAVAADPTPLRPDSLLNWLRIIELDGNRLIYATETDESFFAVSRDREGDLFVAHYAKVALPENAKRKVSVTDPTTGKSVADYSRDKVNLKSATATYGASSLARC